MSRFQAIKLSWAGAEYTVPADSVMRAIAIIEDHITFNELVTASRKRAVPLAKISHAFAAIIGFAGGNVSPEDVYSGMFGGVVEQEKVMASIFGLMSMMIPPEHLRETVPEGNAKPPGKKRPVSSKARGKRR